MADKSGCLSCKVIGTSFLIIASGYVYTQGQKWQKKEARVISIITALGSQFFHNYL